MVASLEQAWDLRRSLKPYRLIMSGLALLMTSAWLAFGLAAGSWFGVVRIPTAITLIGIDWYQWIAVDVGLVRRRWSWWLGQTAEERLFDT